MNQRNKQERTENESVSCIRQGRLLIVTPLCDLDHRCADKIREAADREIDRGKIQNLLFDFSYLHFMDSSGIGVIMGRYKKISYQGGKIACCGAGAEIERILELSGLYRILPKYPDLESAIRALEGGV